VNGNGHGAPTLLHKRGSAHTTAKAYVGVIDPSGTVLSSRYPTCTSAQRLRSLAGGRCDAAGPKKLSRKGCRELLMGDTCPMSGLASY
jgi:hypothetical protein